MSENKVKVLMPLMGEGVNEATLVRWLKSPGETIAKDEPLLEVSTDKVDTEIPSPAEGQVAAVNFGEGDVVKVNDVLAIIVGEGEDFDPAEMQKEFASASSQAPAAAQAGASAQSRASVNQAAPSQTFAGASALPANQMDVKSSPLVRKMAREHDIDLRRVPGTGKNGRITKDDLVSVMEKGALFGNAGGGEALTLDNSLYAVETTKEGDLELLDGVPVRREKMSHMRKKIAEHMVRSIRTSPHVTTTFEVDLHNIVTLREERKEDFKEREGINLTYTAFFTYAAVQAIKKFPIVNCSVDGEDVLYKDDINVGVAVAIDTGLIVPVIKQCQDLSLTGVAHALNDIVVRARSKKLTPDDVRGGTFSITNPGLYGSIHSNPIINQPQVAMLGVGAIVKRPVFLNEEITVRPQCMISLTFDHRVIDGEGGAKYLAYLKEVLETLDSL